MVSIEIKGTAINPNSSNVATRTTSYVKITKAIKSQENFLYYAYDSCRERVCYQHLDLMNALQKEGLYWRLANKYDIEVTLKGSGIYLTNSAFEYLQLLYDKKVINRYLSSNITKKVWTVKENGRARVKTNYLIEPWEASAILYVLKYGIKLMKNLEDVENKERKTVFVSLLETPRLSSYSKSIHFMSIFGLYLMGVMPSSTSAVGYNGVSSYLQDNLINYIPQLQKFMIEYKDTINKINYTEKFGSYAGMDILMKLLSESIK